jgi:hypothetical protein
MRESPTIMMDFENEEWPLQSGVALNAKGQEYRASGVAEDGARRKRQQAEAERHRPGPKGNE